MKPKRRITKAYLNLARKQYDPLIRKLAFQVGVDETQAEELRSQATVELLKCMIWYENRGSFMAFFYGRLFYIFRHMRDAERRAKRIQVVPIDSINNVVSRDYDMDLSITVQECLDCLNEEEREIIMDIYFSEKTTREISYSHGIVASTICRIKARAIDKMKQKCKVGSE